MGNSQKLTVDELIKNAEDLLDIGQYRAAVMEAFTALEERVADVVFSQLENQAKLPSELVQWLKSKTKFSFEDRLHPIGAFALGKAVDKNSSLWEDYKAAKKIRNDVSHTARVVERHEAERVIETVREWLEFVQGADDAPSVFHENDLAKEFFLVFSIFFSRFSGSSRKRSGQRSGNYTDLISEGPFTPEEKNQLYEVMSVRNRLAHVQDVPDEVLRSATDYLKKMNFKNKGREF